MKNRFLLFILITALTLSVVNAQERAADILMESFEGDFPPAGWTITSNSLDIDTGRITTYPAGYDAYHGDVFVYFNCYNSNSGNTATLTMPPFNATDTNTVLSFAMFRDDDYFSKNDRITVQLSIDNGVSWITAETFSRYSPHGDFWEVKKIPILYRRPNMMARFICTSGYGHNVYLDYVRVYLKNERDVQVLTVSPKYVPYGESVNPVVQITNAGYRMEESWSVTLTDGNSYFSTKTGVNLDMRDTIDVLMDRWTPENGLYNLIASVWVEQDDDYLNNELITPVLVGTNAYTSNIKTPKSYRALDLNEGSTVIIASNTVEAIPIGEDYNGSRIYRIYDNHEFGFVRPDGTFESLGFIPELNNVCGMAYHRDLNRWYIMDVEYTTPTGPFFTRLLHLNLSTLTATMVGEGNSTMGYLRGLTYANDGNLYSVSETTSSLVRINPNNAGALKIGSTGINNSFAQDLAFDHYTTMQLYTMAYDLNDNSSKFGTYNMTTGEFTLIKNYGFNNHYTTLCIADPTYTIPSIFNVNFTVKDHNENVIEGALIEVAPTVLETNATGNATFSLGNGVYDYRVIKERFFTHTNYFYVEGANKNVEVKLFPDHSDIEDFVVNDVQIYPNPSDGKVNITAPNGALINVVDLAGRVVSTHSLTNSTLELNLSSGIYFVKVTHHEEVSVHKLIVK